MDSYQTGLCDYHQGVDSSYLLQYLNDGRGGGWSPKQKRAFHRIMSGLFVAKRQGLPIRFLTLTSSDDSPPFSEHNDSFRSLKQKIQRTTVAKLFHAGYISFNDIRRYYPNKGMAEPLRFDYFKVHTNEGNGVYHILFKGDYIPQKFIKDWWQHKHNAWNVNIKKCWGSKKQVAGYVAGQYLADQEESFTRYSWCRAWLFSGAVQHWKYLKTWWRRGVIANLLDAWHKWLEHRMYGGWFPSVTLDDYG